MVKISSDFTAAQMKGFTYFIAGFAALFLVFGIEALKQNFSIPSLVQILIGLLICSVAYFFLRRPKKVYLDAVYDMSDHFLIEKDGVKMQLNYTDVAWHQYSNLSRPPIFTIKLKRDSEIGNEFIFYPIFKVFGGRHPLIESFEEKLK